MTRDAGAPPTWPVAGSGDNATAVGLYSRDRDGALSSRAHRQGLLRDDVAPREGVWSASVSIQAALCDAKFFGLHDRKNPANAALNVYRASDDTWFVLIVTPDKLAAVAKAIGRPDLLTDPTIRRSGQADAEHGAADRNSRRSLRLAADDALVRGLQWRSRHLRRVRGPEEVINDPQLRRTSIVVPLEGAGGKLSSTISSPIQVHGVTKVPAKRAPALGEHNEEVLKQLGFSGSRNRRPCTRAAPCRKEPNGRRPNEAASELRLGSTLTMKEKPWLSFKPPSRDPRMAARPR